ncbi:MULTISPECIES: DedA family protein [Nocardiopsis]|uniref:SNARE associated Golgi protein-related protein n=1 Tax=Nocardiopsis dassonvillei (strain ATCC 23218 / DSM 43111 / CIP 107115 / JCM 7437 / KCTC 9190 / NBRC 14626 / NCTC 10488 / NRRL B-5397 / IMRU 509) TaxID=446468 RepID=D7AXH9_NOCDD|nr:MULTISPECIES: DedA family protein [Nocardiopsis]ADH66053.1 SNARE associated Golgi protein-related protein [Nocardiopsis dassonvillei subsp. dassonvillei DSM 43111]VEI92073.1 SNARE associated Golgi protein [Nocardiopsis dassonvillei]
MTTNLLMTAASTTDVDVAHEYEGFIGWVLSLMTTLGEPGVGVALFIETFFPPMPSEAVLPGAGFLAYAGHMNVWLAILWATIGCLVGAWGFYAIGALLGRERTAWLVEKTPLLEIEDFYKAERFFTRFGGVAVLLGRCVPLVRSFISVPAGIERMPLFKFSLYTVIGSAVWNTIWIGLGYVFGPAIEPILAQWSGVISNIVVVIIGLLVLWFILARVYKRTRARRTEGTSA